VEAEAELDDAEHDHDQEREDERELDCHRAALVVSSSAPAMRPRSAPDPDSVHAAGPPEAGYGEVIGGTIALPANSSVAWD
jgi:hypothetical protein